MHCMVLWSWASKIPLILITSLPVISAFRPLRLLYSAFVRVFF